MRRLLLVSVGLGLVVGVVCWQAQQAQSSAAAAPEAMVAHNVYFSLKESTPEAKQKLVDACKKYLAKAKHPGTVFFAAGTLSEDLNRPVNDRDFDVGLHLVFKDKAAHDKYQDADLHLKFIEENKDAWKRVRVFDSYVSE